MNERLKKDLEKQDIEPYTVLGINLYTPVQVANLLGINNQTVYNMIRRGDIKSTKIGNNYYIAEENIKKYLHGD